MKYIKYLRESIDDSTIKEQINTYLAYLKDEGFELNIENSYDESYSLIIVKDGGQIFEYDDIADYIIAFLEFFDETYEYKIVIHTPDVEIDPWDEITGQSYKRQQTYFELTLDDFIKNIYDITDIKVLSIHDIIPKKVSNIKKFGNFIKKKIFNK